VRFDKERLAASNAELVQRVAKLTSKFGRSVATPAEARRILGLRAA
jgi:3-keto-5-aminohexanoate cleavage enzyme